MKIGVFGGGYVGLVTSASFAEKGNHVVLYDVDNSKIDALNRGTVPIHEPGLADIIKQVTRNHSGEDRNLRFTKSSREAIEGSEVLFCAVGTPFEGGRMNMNYVEGVAESIRDNLGARESVLAIKSTVPVGTTRQFQKYFDDCGRNVTVVSNPEFLVEGKAVEDTRKPDRVIVGVDRNLKRIENIFNELYGPFLFRSGRGVMYMQSASSEMSKFASNALLATRLSFVNEMAEMAEACGADIEEVRRGMGSDPRIGMHYLFPGQGYGGSCFPKDLPTLAGQMRDFGIEPYVLDGTDSRNSAQKKVLAGKVINRLGNKGCLNGRTIGMWGLAFKANTDDIRESPALTAIELMASAGAHVKAYDPVAGNNASKAMDCLVNAGKLRIMDGQYSVLNDADALVICTEWDCFRSPDFERMKKDLKNPLIFDGRNLYRREDMLKREIEYHSIGRSPVLIDGN